MKSMSPPGPADEHRRLSSPAAERNKAPLAEALRPHLPERGTVLEIASGTGQHVAHLAATYPGLDFQPSDADEALHASIAAWSAGLDNVAPPLVLDVRTFPWPLARADVVLCVNMIHIAPWAAGAALIEGAAAILAPGGVLALYGPFRVAGRHTAPSNEAFDLDLRRRNPAWGVRDLETVSALAAQKGFGPPEIVEMPANNLSVVFRRS